MKGLKNNNDRRLVWFDGEFTFLSENNIKFLSMGFVADTGETLYLELKQDMADVGVWVKENVVPFLNPQDDALTESAAVEKIKEWLKEIYGDDKENKPVLVADVNAFDWNGINNLFSINPEDNPFFYIPLDFSTILYMYNIDIDIDRLELAESLNIDTSKIRKHHALDDALLTQKIYVQLLY